MAGPILVLKGERPFFFQIPESAIRDIRKVGDFSEDQIHSLIDSLGKEKGFLGMKGLESVVFNVLGKGEAAESVVRVLWNVEPDDLSQILNSLKEEITDKTGEEDAGTEKFEILKTRLAQLVRACPALERYRKAQRLAEATGQQLEDIQIICDLRPIFDEAREHIEGMFPCTILRVVAEGTDGLSTVTEVNLTLPQVHEIAEKTATAKKKLDRMMKHVREWKPEGLPDLPSTRMPKGEK